MSRLEHKVWAAARRVLTEKQLDAFILRYTSELSWAQIGLELGISRQAAKQRVRRATELVTRELNKEEAA